MAIFQPTGGSVLVSAEIVRQPQPALNAQQVGPEGSVIVSMLCVSLTPLYSVVTCAMKLGIAG